jgi:hypothetical protein
MGTCAGALKEKAPAVSRVSRVSRKAVFEVFINRMFLF